MFGYVRPSAQRLDQTQQDRFGAAYCGLCHTLQRRYGLVARMILNYDLTFLAMLLDEGGSCSCRHRRCMAHPLKKRPCAESLSALDTAADYSVILSWWQLRDGVADHGFWRGLPYRAAACLLRRAYRKARQCQAAFDESTQRQLSQLGELEKTQCASIDRPADTFAILLASAAEGVEDPVRRRVLRQMLYHLGRWIYLTDAADDLQRDLHSGSYNPLALRFSLTDGALTPEDQCQLALTMDCSIEQIAAAFELVDFGQWSEIIRSVVYEGLYSVGNAVLSGTFRKGAKREKKDPIRKAGP